MKGLLVISCLVMFSILLLGFMHLDSTEKYPRDYFRSPVEHPILLSGTFGELRSNHFHSGIDIKPFNGRSGDPILAAAEGEVVRVSVSPGGFGNALYIQHPNGYVTVYAHLNNFIPEIASYVKKMQYEKKSFSVNLFPKKQFFVNKGQTIGFMGTSGSSTGVHLHFEIRRFSKPINPLYFGLELDDQIRPRVNQLVIYELDDRHRTIDQSSVTVSWKEMDTITVSSNYIGIGVETFDMMNHLRNKNGVFGLELSVDDQEVYKIEFESFSFSETRYLNAHADYPTYLNSRKRIHRLYNLPGNSFSLCRIQGQIGVIEISNNQTKQISLNVRDYNENASTLQFTLKGHEIKQRIPPRRSSTIFGYDQDNFFKTENFELTMKPGTLYEDLNFDFLEVSEHSDGILSNTYLLNDESIPIHKYFDIRIKPFPRSLKQFPAKVFIAQCTADGNYISYGGTLDNQFLQTQVRTLGTFTVMIDTTTPTIRPLNFVKNLRGAKTMSFEIKDNIEVDGKAKGLQYNATVDGDWILFEYDAKKDKIFHTFDDRIKPGEHHLKILVYDDRRNKAQFSETFTR